MSSTVIINGKTVNVPKGFFDVGVKASFDENIQANITTEEFTFVLDAYEEIRKWIDDGLRGGVGIFEGIPISILEGVGGANVSVFKGILDLQERTNVQPNLKQITTSLRQDDSLNALDQLLEPLDYGYLRSLNVITKSDYVDVEYVVSPTDQAVATITTLITIYLLSKQLADTIEKLATSVATISGITASGLTGGIGAAIYAVAVAIAQAAYAATLLILIIDFGIDLFNIVVQPTRIHKGISLKTLLEKACSFIGFTLETTIEDLENLVYLPSNISVDTFGLKNVFTRVATISEGIPNVTDIGYTCTQMFQLARQLFNGRFAIQGNTVQFHTEISPFWVSQSGWEKPNSRKDEENFSFRYNTDEIKSSILIQFQTDIRDIYTIENYRGTSFQILTDAINVRNPMNKVVKNLDRVDIPIALGNRKNSLTGFEEGLQSVANLFDRVAGIFGGNPNLARRIQNKVGVLQVSDNNHTVPKLLWMNGNRLPSNHRDLFSAKTLWEKYHVYKSFVQNNFQMQRLYYENEVIPFGLSDFVTLLNNSYFRDQNGAVGKITNLEWNFSKDEATISYWISRPYTSNLRETFIEPSS